MLPETNEDDAANLSATFVTDNSLEEAEAGNGKREQSAEEELVEVAENVEEAAAQIAEIAEVTEPEASVGEVVDVPGDVEPNEKRDQNYDSNKNREDASSDDDEQEKIVEMNPVFESEWADLEKDLAKKEDDKNDLGNEIDSLDAVPKNLSNDIAVNDLAAADGGLSIDPDAEFIDISISGRVPELEKLKISPSSNEDGSTLQNDK
ncbi:uncharacterized protein LOC118750496 [Rhagoletis pomonella]|uniref:uncharacterized protein LOC118750262 n=1 Tax=Rhagoletis pomonella TaxID=28610 RepID=UPI001785ED3E|nr:uncharacterized protein LOC118750262 [Rhagoletis pomonella]XP_036341102.1 uncharacterized protein LOC118750496 [Rhagoletis pomonella]